MYRVVSLESMSIRSPVLLNPELCASEMSHRRVSVSTHRASSGTGQPKGDTTRPDLRARRRDATRFAFFSPQEGTNCSHFILGRPNILLEVRSLVVVRAQDGLLVEDALERAADLLDIGVVDTGLRNGIENAEFV